MVNNNPNMSPVEYFESINNPLHKQFLALRMFFGKGATAEQVASKYGYSVATVYSLVRDFKRKLATGEGDPFFKESQRGRPKLDQGGEIQRLIVAYRKRYLSVPEIKALLDAQDKQVSEKYIYSILTAEGFARLPRRENAVRNQLVRCDATQPLAAEKTECIGFGDDEFSTQLAGLLLFLPIIKSYGIDELIEQSDYPETSALSRLCSILAFLALKLSSVERYSMDDTWCMDRGMGLFAGLNVLPKTAWFSSYSSGITRDMNLSFLRSMRLLWDKENLLSDTMNLDFTAIPYWGDADPFENNWSGKRTKALASLQALLAQDPDSGILCYSDTTVRHRNEHDVVLEFLDFYHLDNGISEKLKYLVFDSRFTTYQNLDKLDKLGLKFITIQRRSKNLDKKIAGVPKSRWKTVRVMRANGKGRTVTACEDSVSITDYDGMIRQVFIAGTGKIKPAIIITNDFDISTEGLIRKYSKRWLVEKDISEHIHFFHLNRNSSGIVVKVDFDLVMTLLAHNLYRLFAMDIDGYSHCEAKTIFNKFILNAGQITISEKDILVKLKKKRTLPLILQQLADSNAAELTYPWLFDKHMQFVAATST
jgi:transposase